MTFLDSKPDDVLTSLLNRAAYAAHLEVKHDIFQQNNVFLPQTDFLHAIENATYWCPLRRARNTMKCSFSECLVVQRGALITFGRSDFFRSPRRRTRAAPASLAALMTRKFQPSH